MHRPWLTHSPHHDEVGAVVADSPPGHRTASACWYIRLMSAHDIVFGFIEEPFLGPAKADVTDALHQLNLQVIDRLPAVDSWPPIHRGWFSFSDEQGSFRHGLIHFGGTLKRDDDLFPAFVAKFEGLLRKLAWESASLRRHTAFTGHYVYEWQASKEWLDNAHGQIVAPVSAWQRSERVEGLGNTR